jgi:hypothetical protein
MRPGPCLVVVDEVSAEVVVVEVDTVGRRGARGGGSHRRHNIARGRGGCGGGSRRCHHAARGGGGWGGGSSCRHHAAAHGGEECRARVS